MTLIQNFINSFRKKLYFSSPSSFHKLKFLGFNPIFLFSLLVIFTVVFILGLNFSNKKNVENKKNLEVVTKSAEFSNFTDFLISKINSPYREIKYQIKNNDSIEKIMRKFDIKSEDIKNISLKLKQKRLSSIYSGRELSMISKKLEDGSNTVVNLLFPINNTISIEVRKSENDFIVKENILKLNKKEVVVRNVIRNNLYSSAVNANIEPNIIIEFARIFGFEVDFQRDIRKGDWFEIYYEKFEDDNNKVRDTGKIIYASMYVNGEEINLYNFNYKNEEEYYDIKGKSITKSLMKTPINGARLSSSYGMRKIHFRI